MKEICGDGEALKLLQNLLQEKLRIMEDKSGTMQSDEEFLLGTW